MTKPRLLMHEVGKSFGATIALKNVSLEIAPGEVHALIGENGAGKSTLMKVLSGACAPDRGVIEIDGARFIPANPHHALRSGIAMIYQELNLAPHLSVEENILLGSEPAAFGWIDRRERRRRAEAALAKLDCAHIPLDPPLYRCSLAEKQMVEIARALVGRPRILIMDEPTSSLTRADADKLFAVIRRLREQGVSIIYISHFLEECKQLADRYTVLRDGETVSAGEMASVELPKIIRLMVGREIKDIYPRTPHNIGQPLLEVRGLAGVKKPSLVNLTLHAGEILGIAGLIGAGRTETLRVVFGLERTASGETRVGGVETAKSSPRSRLRDGIGLLSENRKEEGLMLNRSLADNLTMTRLNPFSRCGIISNRLQRAATLGWMENLSVRAQSPAQKISDLSGGNQQKIAIGRLLHHQARILLLDEPTRGIDVASKAQVYELVGKLAREGKGIIFVSSYLPELLGVCDTIAVMCRGVITAVKPVQEWTEHAIIGAAIGQGTEL